MERMEHHVEELHFIDWWNREGQHIDWAARLSESREDVRAPESLDELFCDDCDTFHYRLGVIGEKHVCPSCWDDRGYATQQQLDTAVTSTTGSPAAEQVYAIVGCGKAKQEGTHPARELYTAPYFAKKRRWAEELADAWLILSAEHGLIDPDTEIACYDTAIEDIAVDRWLDDVHSSVDQYLADSQAVWVLAGKRYVDAADDTGRTLRHVLNPYEPRYPFDQTTGISTQQQWLEQCIERGERAMPYQLDRSNQTGLDSF